jgi:hypothetical protein
MEDMIAEVIDQAGEIDNLRAIVAEQDYQISLKDQAIADLNAVLNVYREIFDRMDEDFNNGEDGFYR